MPGSVAVSLVALAAIHAAFSLLGDNAQSEVLNQLAFVPGRLTLYFDPRPLQALLGRAGSDPGALEQAEALRFFGAGMVLKPWTLVSYGLLHGSWTHLGLNCVWLLAFGSPVALRIGAARFFAFAALAAAAGALAHWAAAPLAAAPIIGASAAVSGLMGAAARFAFAPGGALGGGGATAGPLRPLATLARDRRTLLFIGVWLFTNFLFGAGAVDMGLSQAPVAWIAHIGGFAFGLLVFPAFDRATPNVPVPETGKA